MKQDKAAKAIVEGITFGTPRPADDTWFYDRLSYDAQALYIIARHFPERASAVTPAELDAIVDPIFRGAYNTFSSAWSILALEAYASTVAATAPAGAFTIDEVRGGQPHALTLPQSLLPVVPFSPAATAIRFGASGPFGGYFVVSEAGFDTAVPDKPKANFVEVFRTYEDADGKPVTSVKLGDEVTAVLRMRALQRPSVNGLAIVDLLPGGFEPVIQARAPATETGGDTAAAEGESEGGAEVDSDDGAGESESGDEGGGDPGTTTASFGLSIALPGNTFVPEFGDVREDRVVLYGSAAGEVTELRYTMKATNVGTYTIAPVQATAMYDSTVVGRGAGGKIVVVPR